MNYSLIVKGQGVFMFENNDTVNKCLFTIYDDNRKNGLKVFFSKEGVRVYIISSKEPLNDINNRKIGLVNKKGAYYWFSIDAQNLRLQAGIGEARIENVIYEYRFQNHIEKSFLETLSVIYISTESHYLVPFRLLRDPINYKVPLIIKDTDQLTMHHIAHAKFLPKSNLSFAAQRLYDCIAGDKFKLDDKEFEDFSKAIEYSIATPGCWCYEKLLAKSKEFSKEGNINETYLRITLGENNGESPGIPYVMEIWPVGHFSPVHNHAGANAIIKVLHGTINVCLFPFLCWDKTGVEPFTRVDLVKDEITWISPTLNQTHQLMNLTNNKDTCVTIQCYLYAGDDEAHYDYFDYIDENGNKQQYEPDSDMDYIQFRKIMKHEWENRPRTLLSRLLALFF